MTVRQESLTVTLHWLAEGREQMTTVVCEDSPPARLLPLLLAGCGLAGPGAAAPARPYQLRVGAAEGRALRASAPLSQQGVRSGGHLWLSDYVATKQARCLLQLPDGSETLAPRCGVTLTRGWLLQLLALHSPTAHARELALLAQRSSAYAYVSKRPHCLLAPDARGAWIVASERADVATLLNDVRLVPGAAAALGDGDRLTLGDGGLPLRIGLA
jgi:hypothetical protein